MQRGVSVCLSVCLSGRVSLHESDNLMGLTNLATIFAAVLVSSDAVSHLFTYLFIYVSVSYVFYYVQFYCLLSLLHL